MKVLGQCDTDGNYTAYVNPSVVTQIENRLVDREFGTIIGVKDSYGDWVSYVLHNVGLKCKLKVEND